MDRIERMKNLVGRPVVSLETANKLGAVSDLLIDPCSGELTGLAVQRAADQGDALVSILDVHAIGPDAFVVEGDQSLVLTAASPLNTLARARADLVAVKVLTEHGQLVGNIADLFLCLDNRPRFIYEIRSSFLDKLMGRAYYFAASLGCAFSGDRSVLVVPGGIEQMDHRLESAAERLLGYRPSSGPPAMSVRVQVRSHAQ